MEIPKFETQETMRRQLIFALRNWGLDNQETQKLLQAWSIAQEKEVEMSQDYRASQIQFTIVRARLYYDAGMIDEAFENYNDAREQALNENKDELYKKIMDEMDTVDDNLNE